jgi:hypothetical protein
MEVEDELEVEEEQQEMVQPVVQESHQFNDSALINSSSSEGSVNMGAVPQQLVINRIEVQFEVLGKDLTSLLDRVFPAYTNFMQSCVVGPVLPKDMVLDKVYKGLVPVLFMNTIPSVWPAHKFDWITKSMPFPELAHSTCEITDAVGKVVARRGKRVIPPTTRVTRSALKAQAQIQKQVWNKGSRKNSFAAATSLFTEKSDSSSWTDSSVRRCTRHMAKTDGYKFESIQDKSSVKRKPKVSKPDRAEGEEVTPFISVPVLQRIGRQLEISDEELTREKLMAAPKDPKDKKSSNED